MSMREEGFGREAVPPHKFQSDIATSSINEATPADPDTVSDQTLEDSIAPSLTVAHIADGDNGWNVSDPVTVHVNASDGGSGLDGAPSCEVDNSPASLSGSGPWTLSVSGEGEHDVDCSVSDLASNSARAS